MKFNFSILSNMFEHPANVCMTYFRHFIFALEMSWYLGVGCAKSVIHAFIPDLFVTSVTDTTNLIQQRLLQVGCRNTKS